MPGRSWNCLQNRSRHFAREFPDVARWSTICRAPDGGPNFRMPLRIERALFNEGCRRAAAFVPKMYVLQAGGGYSSALIEENHYDPRTRVSRDMPRFALSFPEYVRPH